MSISSNKIINSICKCISHTAKYQTKHDVLQFILNEIIEVTHNDFGFIGEKQQDIDNKVFYRYYAFKMDYEGSFKQQLDQKFNKNKYIDFFPLDNLHKKVLDAKSHIICNDIDKIRKKPFPQGHPIIKKFLAVPIMNDSQVIGIIGLSRSGQDYTESDVDILKPYLSLISSTIIQINNIQDLDHHKTLFLANMSHELRTPLNGIVCMARDLSDTKMTDDQVDSIDVITHCSVQLLDIVNDILDYSKMITGKMELTLKPMSISTCIKNVVDILSNKAKEKNIELKYHISENVPESILSDNTRVSQIFINLLSNSIKFTPSGGTVDIRINSEHKENGEFTLLCSVIDDGIGIPKNKLDMVFETFRQVNNNYLSGNTGVGLGLPITKYLVGLFNGDISIESDEGKGTKIKFNIQVRKYGGNMNSATLKKFFSEKQVLLFDNDPHERMAIFTLLTEIGIKPIMCLSIKDALMYLKSNVFNFDFLIIDRKDLTPDNIVSLNGMKEHGIKVIIVDEGSIENKVSYDYKLVRPIDTNKLFELFTIVYISQIYTKKLKRVSTDSITIQEDPQPITNINEIRANLKIIVAEDNTQNVRVINKLLNKLGYFNITVVYDGLDFFMNVSKNSYDIAFVDLKMPILDGISAVKKLRDTKNELFCVAVTASSSETVRAKCHELGMRFITKPIYLSELKTTLDIVVQQEKYQKLNN